MLNISLTSDKASHPTNVLVVVQDPISLKLSKVQHNVHICTNVRSKPVSNTTFFNESTHHSDEHPYRPLENVGNTQGTHREGLKKQKWVINAWGDGSVVTIRMTPEPPWRHKVDAEDTVVNHGNKNGVR